MPTFRHASLAFFSLCLFCPGAYAQGQAVAAQADRPPVVASAASGRVRFAAPNRVARLKLEVVSASGEVLAEVSTRGSVLDWTLSDSQGARLQDGQYLCVLTVKDVTGRITQRLTLVEVTGGAAVTRPASAADLTDKQAEAVGPVEAEAAGVIAAGGDDAPAAVLTAHDGEAGQIVTTSGDLSFRGGDFFTGRDKELMRLSADGSLEVTGQFFARGGIRFADGTVLESARGVGRVGGKGAKAGVGAAGGGGDATQATADRLVKYLDGVGTQGDSAVTESAGRVGIGTTSPAQALHVFGKGLFQNAGTASLFIVDRTDGKIAALGAGGVSATFAYDNTGIFKIESSPRSTIAQGLFGPEVGATTRLMIDTSGRVGIGTTSPSTKLQVDGGNFMVRGPSNFGGAESGASVFMGDHFNYIGAVFDHGIVISTFGAQNGITLRSNSGNVGIGTLQPAARLHVVAPGATALDNTAHFAAPNIGPNASHVHYGTTGDWYVRSAAGTGKVILQDTGGRVGVGTNNPTVGKLEVQTAASTSVAVFGKATGSGSAGGQFEGTGQGVVGIGNSYGVYARTKGQGAGAVALQAECDIPASCLAGRFNSNVHVATDVTANGHMYASSFVSTSDRDAKTNFAAVEPRSVLRRLASVPVSTWSFKGQGGGGARHMGPVAQDFRAAFGLGTGDKHIATVDADGVLMASLQGLYQMVQEKEKEIGQLRARVARLERRRGRRARAVRR